MGRLENVVYLWLFSSFAPLLYTVVTSVPRSGCGLSRLNLLCWNYKGRQILITFKLSFH